MAELVTTKKNANPLGKLKSFLSDSTKRLGDNQSKLQESGYRSLNNSGSKDLNDQRSSLAMIHVRNELQTMKSVLVTSISRQSSFDREAATINKSSVLPALKDRFIGVESILKAHEHEVEAELNLRKIKRPRKNVINKFSVSREKASNQKRTIVPFTLDYDKTSPTSEIKLVPTDNETALRRSIESPDDSDLWKRKTIFKAKPIKNMHNSTAHLLASETQLKEYLMRSKKTGWVKYPPNVVMANLNYFDFYMTVRDQSDLDFFRNGYSRAKKATEAKLPVIENLWVQDNDAEKIEKMFRDKIRERLDLRVNREDKERKKIIRDNRTKHKLRKAISFDILEKKEVEDSQPKNEETEKNIDTEMTEPWVLKPENQKEETAKKPLNTKHREWMAGSLSKKKLPKQT